MFVLRTIACVQLAKNEASICGGYRLTGRVAVLAYRNGRFWVQPPVVHSVCNVRNQNVELSHRRTCAGDYYATEPSVISGGTLCSKTNMLTSDRSGILMRMRVPQTRRPSLLIIKRRRLARLAKLDALIIDWVVNPVG